MSHPLPGQTPGPTTEERAREQWAQVAQYERINTDREGFYRGPVNGPVHVIDDEVPDNAHWKGWVW